MLFALGIYLNIPKRLLRAEIADVAVAAAACCSSAVCAVVVAAVLAAPVRLDSADDKADDAADVAAEVIADVAAVVADETAELASDDTSRLEMEPRVLSTEGVLPVVTRLEDPLTSPSMKEVGVFAVVASLLRPLRLVIKEMRFVMLVGLEMSSLPSVLYWV